MSCIVICLYAQEDDVRKDDSTQDKFENCTLQEVFKVHTALCAPTFMMCNTPWIFMRDAQLFFLISQVVIWVF